jgi:hypothetical protein
VKKRKDGTSQFLPGTPIVSETFDHQMLFDVHTPVENNGEVTLSKNSVTQKYTTVVSAIVLSHGELLIWQPRNDKRYMHVLCFKKEDTAK